MEGEGGDEGRKGGGGGGRRGREGGREGGRARGDQGKGPIGGLPGAFTLSFFNNLFFRVFFESNVSQMMKHGALRQCPYVLQSNQMKKQVLLLVA